MESHDPEEEEQATTPPEPPMKAGGVEDVGPVQSGPVTSTGKVGEACHYLCCAQGVVCIVFVSHWCILLVMVWV